MDYWQEIDGCFSNYNPGNCYLFYKTGKTSDQEILDELNGKVENVIQKCNGLAEFPEDDELEEELNEVQNRKRRRIVVG